jgi:hypothetical protein
MSLLAAKKKSWFCLPYKKISEIKLCNQNKALLILFLTGVHLKLAQTLNGFITTEMHIVDIFLKISKTIGKKRLFDSYGQFKDQFQIESAICINQN